MLNQTVHPNYDAELLYESLYGGTQGKILLYWSIFQFSFVGPVLMFGIVIFEMFGGDSQKRTIINRLLSAILINTAIWSILGGVVRIVRDTCGLIDLDLALFFRLSLIFLRTSIYIFYNLLTISRFLFIVVWKRMRGVQDKFWMLFLTITTYLISFLFVGLIWLSGTHPNAGLMIFLAKDSGQNGTSHHRYINYQLKNI